MKRILAMLLAAMLVLSMGVVAFAEGTQVVFIGEQGYDSLQAAVEASTGTAAEPTTIKLTGNYSGGGIYLGTTAANYTSVTNKHFVLDLGGYTVTLTGPSVGSAGYETQGFHIEKDNTVTIKNGIIKVDNNNVPTGTEPIKMLVNNYTNLTLEDVTLDGTGLELETTRYVLSNNCGTVTVKGATNIIAPAGHVAFDVFYSDYYSEGVTVNFDETYTGTVTGKIEVSNNEKADLNIKAGTFEVTDAATIGFICENVVSNSGNKVTVKFANDITGKGIFLGRTDAEKNIVFDLNRNTFTCDDPVGSGGTESQAMHFEKGWNVTLKNGTVVGKADVEDGTATGDVVKVLVQNYANLVLDDVKLNGAANEHVQFTLGVNNDDVVVTGNTQIIAGKGGNNPLAIAMGNSYYADGTSLVFDEEFTGSVKGEIDYENNAKDSLKIENGDFSESEITVHGTAADAKITITGGKIPATENTFTPFIAEGIKVENGVVNPPEVPEAPKPDPCDHDFDANGKCKDCGIIVIDHTASKPAQEANPDTGAETVIGVAAAVAVISLAGIAVSKRK